MSNFFKKIISNIRLFFHYLFVGMKNVDALMTNNQKNNDSSGYEVSDSAGDGVFKDILEQKVTQEVEELRYASYEVAKKSKNYRYVGNGKAVKKSNSQLSLKHGFLDESDNLPIILVQDNKMVCEDVLTVLNEVNEDKNKKIFKDYTLKIKRDFFPRFLIEEFIRKIVIKQADGNYVIDLYCSKYPSQFNEKRSRAFLSELKKIKNGNIRNSDVLDINEISFISSNAWGVDDWFLFEFNEFDLNSITEFDGNFIIRFGCQAKTFMKNILDKIYSKSAEEKYQNKSMKENAVIHLNSFMKPEEYVISETIDLDALEKVKFSIEKE
jgi:hypothetical protein